MAHRSPQATVCVATLMALAASVVGVSGCGKNTLNLQSVNARVPVPAPTASVSRERPDATRAKFKASLKGLPPRALTLGDALATALVPDSDTGLGAKALDAILAALRTPTGTLRPEAEALAILEFAQKYASNIAALAQGDLAALTAFLAKAASEGVLASFDAGVFDTLKEQGTAGVDALVASKVAGVSTSPTPTPSGGGANSGNTANTAPTAPTSVTVSPSTFDAGSTLTCAFVGGSDAEGDTLTPVYTWYKNGTLIAGATTNTLVPGSLAKGDSVKCAVALGDATLLSAFTESTSGLVGNRAPNAFTPTLSSSTNRRGGSFTCSATPPSDPDGDAVGAASYRWLQQGVVIAGQTASTFSDAGNVLVKGNTLACEVTFSDATDARTATASTTVGNTLPVMGTCLNQYAQSMAQYEFIYEPVLTTQTYNRLDCAATDADVGDTVSWSVHGCDNRYEIDVNGVVTLATGKRALGHRCYLSVAATDGTDTVYTHFGVGPVDQNVGDFLGADDKVDRYVRSFLPVPGDPDKYLVAGEFGRINGSKLSHIARINANGTFASNGGGELSGWGKVFDTHLVDTDGVLIGGDFDSIESASSSEAPKLLWMKSNGSLATGVGEMHHDANMGLAVNGTPMGPDGPVNAITSNGLAAGSRKIVVGGAFTKVRQRNGSATLGGVTEHAYAKLACLTNTGALCSGWSGTQAAVPNGNITAVEYALRAGAHTVVVGGAFTSLSGANHYGLARLSLDDGTLDPTFSTGDGFKLSGGRNYKIETIYYDPGSERIYVGGQFDTYNNDPVQNFVVLTWTGARDTTYDGAGSTGLQPRFHDIVEVIKGYDSQIYVGGGFDDLTPAGGGSSVHFPGIVRLSPADGTLDTTFCPGGTMPGCTFSAPNVEEFLDVRDIAFTDDDRMYIAGQTVGYGDDGDAPGALLLVDVDQAGNDGALDATFKSNAGLGLKRYFFNDEEATAITVLSDNSAFVGGKLVMYGGAAADNLALWDVSDKAYVPAFSSTNTLDETVHALYPDPVDATKYYAAGNFCGGTLNGVSFASNAGYGTCGIVRISYGTNARDTTFNGLRSIYFDPSALAFIPDDAAHGDGAGDILAIGWFNRGDSNLESSAFDYDGFGLRLRHLARLNRDGTFDDAHFDTGFGPWDDIGLSKGADTITYDPIRKRVLIPNLWSLDMGESWRYRGEVLPTNEVHIDLQGNRVGP